MTRASIAELILSLAMPPERAASTIGDLLESSLQPLRFWWAIFRTLTSAAFHQMSIVTATKSFFLIGLSTIASRWIFFTALNWGERAFPSLARTGPIWGVTFLLLSPLFIGHFVATKMPGREMAISITYLLALLAWVIASASALALFPHNILVFVNPLGLPLTLIGSLLARRRQLHSEGAAA